MVSEYTSYVRILHAVPNAPPIDVYVNDVLMVSNLKYKEFSEYQRAVPGEYNFKAYLAGSNAVVFSQNYEINDNWIYTLVCSGLERQVTADLIGDNRKAHNKSKAYMQFANVSPTKTKYDIYMNDIMKIDNFGFRMLSVYYPEDGGRYRFTAVDSVTGQTKLIHPNIMLKNGSNYAGYIVGLDGGEPGLELLIPLEGSSYLPEA